MSDVRRRVKIDPTGGADGRGEVVIESTQDVTEILRWNRELYNATDHSGTKWRSKVGAQWTLVASIPNIFIDDMMQTKGINFYTPEGYAWFKKNVLNNSDYLKFRTAPGRV